MDQVPDHYEWKKAPKGAPIPLSEFQRLDDLASRDVDQDGGFCGDSIASPGMGTSFIPVGMQTMWVEITGRQSGSYALYSWRRVVTLNSQHVHPDGEASTPIYNLLEVSGNHAVPTGAVVPAWQSEDEGGTSWRFLYPANPNPTTPVDCVIWYTGYLHLASATVSVNQILEPQQTIGYIGEYPGDPHLHFSLGDGQSLLNFSSPYSLVGQTVDISGWLGISVVGSFNPTVEGPGSTTLTSAELLAIRQRTGSPVPEGYVNYRGSTAHAGREYYAHDFGKPPLGDAAEVGDLVFNTAITDDVITTVHWIGFSAGSGWAVVLKHTIGPCEGGSGESGSGSGGPVETPCCPGGLPETIYITLRGEEDCVCITGTYPLVWDADDEQWQFTGAVCDDEPLEMVVYCEDGELILHIACGAGSGQQTWQGTSSTCDPMNFGTLTASGGPDCCTGDLTGDGPWPFPDPPFVPPPGSDDIPYPSGMWVVTNVCPIYEYIETGGEGCCYTFESSSTVTFTVVDDTVTADVVSQMSIDSDASGLRLVNDEEAPGNDQYYGTDSGGTKGWYALPDVSGFLTDADIGVTVQAFDATLAAFAALTITANSLTIGTGADAFSQTAFGANTFPARASTGSLVAKTISDFALTILDDADAATVRATIGAGTSSFSGAFADLSGIPTTLSGYGITDAQPLDATLTALAALTIAANSLTIGTGADAFSQTTFAANTFPARASTGNLVAKTITDFGLSLVDDANAAAARTTLGGSTAGQAVFTVSNPGVISFLRFNADNSVTLLNESGMRTAIGLGLVENTALSTWVGSSNITNVGTVAFGTWDATTITVNRGGTGQTTLTSNGVLIGNGTSGITATAEGATGKILTGVTGGDPTWQDPVTAASDEAIKSSDQSLASANGTWDDVTGLSLSLPAAGTYLVTAVIRVALESASGPGTISARLDLNGSTVSDSQILCGLAPITGSQYQVTATLVRKITAAGAHTIKVQAKRDYSSSWTTSAITSSNTDGRSSLSYVRIA